VCEERAKSNKIVAVYLGRELAKEREMVTLVNGKEACTLRDSNPENCKNYKRKAQFNR